MPAGRVEVGVVAAGMVDVSDISSVVIVVILLVVSVVESSCLILAEDASFSGTAPMVVASVVEKASAPSGTALMVVVGPPVVVGDAHS